MLQVTSVPFLFLLKSILGLRGVLVFGIFGIQSAQAAPLSQEPHRAIYQVYVRAFFDGSQVHDGEGDLRGLWNKVDYLEDLGVDTLLLMPIFYSTGDMGYIPRDYFRLDPAYGSIDDFGEVLRAFRKRGFKVVLDAPVNHISVDSEWFRRASSKECEGRSDGICGFFYFDNRPCETVPFSRWRKPWRYHETDCRAVWFPPRTRTNPDSRREWFYATFFSVMPDLNFWDFSRSQWNEPVVGEIDRFFRTWVDLGTDGFRIDAAKHFVEGWDSNSNPLEPRNMELLKRFLNVARERNRDVSFIGEIWSGHNEFEPYVTAGALDMVLDFPYLSAVRDSVRADFGESMKSIWSHYERRQTEIGFGQRVVFSGNHDVSRLATEFVDESQTRMAHFLALTSPYTPLLYYGEELGMSGKVKRPDQQSDEEYVRTINAFPWHGRDLSVGFPGGKTPVAGLPDNYRTANLEIQNQRSQSLFHLVRSLLRLRKDFQFDSQGQFRVRQDLFGHVVGWTYRHPSGKCWMVMVNMDPRNVYDVPALDSGLGCGDRFEIGFRENLETITEQNMGSQFRMKGRGKLILISRQ